MILMGVNPLLGPLEGVGPENIDFFRPTFGDQDSLVFQKNYVPRHINNRYIISYKRDFEET